MSSAHRKAEYQLLPGLALVSGRPHRSLKNLFQEARIPLWQRQRLPMLYYNDILVAIPGIGIACGSQVRAEETGLRVSWVIE